MRKCLEVFLVTPRAARVGIIGSESEPISEDLCLPLVTEVRGLPAFAFPIFVSIVPRLRSAFTWKNGPPRSTGLPPYDG